MMAQFCEIWCEDGMSAWNAYYRLAIVDRGKHENNTWKITVDDTYKKRITMEVLSKNTVEDWYKGKRTMLKNNGE